MKKLSILGVDHHRRAHVEALDKLEKVQLLQDSSDCETNLQDRYVDSSSSSLGAATGHAANERETPMKLRVDPISAIGQIPKRAR